MTRRPPWEAKGHSTGQISRLLWDPKVRYGHHNSRYSSLSGNRWQHSITERNIFVNENSSKWKLMLFPIELCSSKLNNSHVFFVCWCRFIGAFEWCKGSEISKTIYAFCLVSFPRQRLRKHATLTKVYVRRMLNRTHTDFTTLARQCSRHAHTGRHRKSYKYFTSVFTSVPYGKKRETVCTA
jgi:hypothetical protein